VRGFVVNPVTVLQTTFREEVTDVAEVFVEFTESVEPKMDSVRCPRLRK
jgi:hypothetical protein